MNRPALSVALFAFLMAGMPAAMAVAAPAPVKAPDASVATEDVKAAYEKGDYKETLRLLGRILSLKGKAAEGLDRYELLMLRAESHLHLKAGTAAIQAAEEAAKAAPDDNAAAKARALAVLIKRSKSMEYTPKAATEGSKGPLDITDAEKRGDAFKALYAEEKLSARAKVQAAEKAKALPQIATALKAVVPLKDLEVAATDQDAETAETLNALTDRAHKLIARELDDMTKRTEKIAARASELIDETFSRPNGTQELRTRQRGLDNNATKELKTTIETCKRIIKTCDELAEGFAKEKEPFEDLQDVAKSTAERADEVLKDDYSRAR
jgi:hypothetical protein